jgi:hypothetical protein
VNLVKLSRLQRWILSAACENRSADPAADSDLYYHEILAGYFGFPMRWHADKPWHLSPGLHHFDREAIGHARYHAAQASIGRAVRRLEARGLVERRKPACGGTGLRIADAAVEAARNLRTAATYRVAGAPGASSSFTSVRTLCR